jgi:hypothetical protein
MINFLYLLFSYALPQQINLETCISISDWFGYTFFEYPKIEKGFCMVNHAGKTAQMSMFCEENLPLLECFSNTKTF